MSKEESLEKYEDVIELLHLVEETNQQEYWSEEIDRIIAALDKYGWGPSDGEVHEIVAHVLDEHNKLKNLEIFLNEGLTVLLELGLLSRDTFNIIRKEVSKIVK